MGFLDVSTKKLFEGRFLKFEDGVTRHIKLLSSKSVQKKASNGEEYTAQEFTVIDLETGDEKVFNPSRNFIQKLAKIDHLLSAGSSITVIPLTKNYTDREGNAKTTLDYDITLYQESL